MFVLDEVPAQSEPPEVHPRLRELDTRAEKIRIKAVYNVYRRHVTPEFAKVLQELRAMRLGDQHG